MRKCMTIVAVAAVVLTCVSGAQADVVMETVPIDNVGNAADAYGEGYGAVSYAYNIGKYEVTAGQYTEFLNAVASSDPHGLYNGDMASILTGGCLITQNGSSGSYTYDFSGRPCGTEADWANRPVNYVNWYDALRFANWLHNGQGSGDTEDGAYDMSLGSNVVRKPGALVFLLSEDEWYKAAYHKNDGVTGNYFGYPMSNNSAPNNDLVDPDPGNHATFYNAGYTIGSPYYRTEVGAHENSESPYGTFDQGGNLWEWNEAVIDSRRGLRGGSFNSLGHGVNLHAATRAADLPTYEYSTIGFRVAEVPEPSTLAMLALSGVVMLKRRGRSKR